MRFVSIFPLDVFIVGFYGWLIGRVVRAVIRMRKIAAVGPALVVAVVAGLLAVWFAWLAFWFFFYDYSFEAYFHYLLHPIDMIGDIKYLADHSTLKISSFTHPLLYHVAWIGEVLLVCGVAAYDVYSFVANSKLCPTCGDWLKETEEQAWFRYPVDTALVQRLRDGEVAALWELERLYGLADVERWIHVVRYVCDTCESGNSFIRFFVGTRTWDKDKEEHVIGMSALSDYREIDEETEKKIFIPIIESEEPDADEAEAPVTEEE